MLQGPSAALILQAGILDFVKQGTVFTYAVLGVLAFFSILSLAIAFSKWAAFSSAQNLDSKFIRAFRKAISLDAMVSVSESFRPAPLVSVFEDAYEEVYRQSKTTKGVSNVPAISRVLQVGVTEQLLRFEQNLNWLATIASVSPFIGLFGTVMGIMRVFGSLGSTGGATSLTAVGPGVAEALITTGVGLVAAIPAAIFYNLFGRKLKEMGDRFDNFSLEFLNMAERPAGE